MAIRKAQRKSGTAVDHDKREKDDFYSSDPAALDALFRVERFQGSIWECAAGEGHLSKAIENNGYHVISTDLVDRGYGTPRVDFLLEPKAIAPNIITNPPYKMELDFMRHAVKLARGKVAFLLRINSLAGQKRAEFYREFPPARIWVISNRIKMYRGGVAVKGSGMFDFMWIVWYAGYRGHTKLGFINTDKFKD